MSGQVRARLIGALAMTAGLMALAAPALAAPADPSGTYLTEDGRARIRIEKCGPTRANICGFVVWMKQPMNERGEPKTDVRNPDPSKTGRRLLGHQLIMGLKPGDENYQGQIYNNEDGKSYSVTLWLASSQTLKVKGCLIAFLCSTQDWTRTTDTLPGQLAGVTGTADGPTANPEWAVRPTSTGSAATAPHRDARPKTQ
ncbi:MAG: DUF2147 domain-containing protein [Methylobacteriaceae bacterium]|nr:DUF2147 domain-containing protein [Methylobacteriaceae bacterium]